MRVVLVVVAAVWALALPASAGLASQSGTNDYGIFCVNGRLTLDRRCIEELKSAHGRDVCRLDQDATEAGAREKASRLGGAGAACTCE